MKDRLPALDGVRGLALLLVFFYHVRACGHATAVSFLDQAFLRVAREGWVGVDLFFVLSGFLITGILRRTRTTEHYYRNFIMRRVLRIFPLYYLFIVVFFLVLPHVFPWHPELRKLPSQQAWYWLYIPNVHIFLRGDWYALYADHTWSLAIEEQFYLVWPLVVLLCSRRRLLWVCGLCTAGSLALRLWLTFHGADYTRTLVLTPAHLDGLLLGSSLAVLLDRPADGPARLRPMLALAGMVATCGLAATPFLPVSYSTKHYALTVTWWSLLFTSMIGLTVTGSSRSPLVRLFNLAPLRFVGVYSYGLYLLHEPILHELASWLPAAHGPAVLYWLALAVIGGALTTGLALAAYHGYEMRFLDLKRFFPSGRARPQPDIAAGERATA